MKRTENNKLYGTDFEKLCNGIEYGFVDLDTDINMLFWNTYSHSETRR